MIAFKIRINEVVGLVDHCEMTKVLIEYLEILYFGKWNISQIYKLYQSFYLIDKGDKSLTTHFMEFKKTNEKLNILLPFNSDNKKQQT